MHNSAPLGWGACGGASLDPQSLSKSDPPPGLTQPPPPPPPAIKILGQNFLRAFGRSKFFSGAFRANWFRPKIFFGASNNSAPLGLGWGAGTPPPLKKKALVQGPGFSVLCGVQGFFLIPPPRISKRLLNFFCL